MALAKLKAITIQKLNKPGKYGDGGGLYLVIGRNGKKTWSYRFTLNARAREMGLGSLDDIPITYARDLAAEARLQVRQGKDPIQVREFKKQAEAIKAARRITFDECAQQYIETHAPSWKSKKHQEQWRNTLATYASPIIGKLPVQDVDTNLVIKILEPIWLTKTETASRVRMRIEAILDWAKVRNFRSGENSARWKGHLNNILPARSKVQKAKHFKALDFREIPRFMAQLRAQEGVGALALQFTILTAARTTEVREATPDEFDLSNCLWIVPGERMKAGRPHTVPLSDSASQIVASMLESHQEQYIFPGGRPGSALSNGGLSSVLRRMGADITVHGFRSTFRDWTAERTNTPSWVAEKALAHVVADKVEAAYRRGELLDKRRILMAQWAQYCESKPGEVVKIGKASGGGQPN